MTSPGQKNTAKSWDRDEDDKRQTADTAETSKVLEIKRWEVHEGPFRGFNSPPGRF